MRTLFLTLILAAGCCKAQTPTADSSQAAAVTAPAPARALLVAADNPLFSRVEGAEFKNQCSSDSECVVSGCSQEVCAAEEAMTTCERPVEPFPGHGGKCGCVAAECRWYGDPAAGNGSGNGDGDGSGNGTGDGKLRGKACPKEGCPTGMTCSRYYGIAGPKGPEFSSCETTCKPGGACPDGLKCVTIADGPGSVCR